MTHPRTQNTPIADPAPLPPVHMVQAALSYMLTAHRCEDGPVVYSFGTGEDATIGIKACPVDFLPPTAEEIHPYRRATRGLRASAPIPLWGFGLSYDGYAEFSTVDASPEMRAALAAGTLSTRPNARRVCATTIFDYTGDRRDLLRIDGQTNTTAIHIPGETNPFPPPGPEAHLWSAAIALDPANPARLASQPSAGTTGTALRLRRHSDDPCRHNL
ncbi:hypothetical protein [Nocardia abscessus]|uniref:hypothetical protein n=1 Tax=Nocardia abscessus TaxID=120957 RepID=UPI002457CF55|nr:hypothetical protein [Nocardia abscessus]